jgi:hypothetical protein
MSAHQFRITVEYLGGKHAGPDLHEPVVFEAGNHDDIINIIEGVQATSVFDRDTSAALVLGMKLFSEVMLKHRKDPLFEPMQAAYREYIGQFKLRMNEARNQQDGQTRPKITDDADPSI